MRPKIIYTLLFLILINLSGYGQVKNTKVAFETLTHDFGKINEADSEVSYTFRYKNTGDAPLIIYSVGVSCGCTTPQWDKAPLAPGKEGTMKITFDPAGRPGRFDKVINISCNIEGGAVKLVVSGVVNPKPRTIVDDYTIPLSEGIRIATRVVMWGNVPRDAVSYEVLPIANNSDADVKIETDGSLLPPYITLEPTALTIASRERAEIRLKFDGTKTDLWGIQEFDFYLIINGVRYDVPIGSRMTVVENFKNLTKLQLQNAPSSEYSSYFYHFSTQPVGAKLVREFTLTNAGQDDLIIRHIGFDERNVDVQTTKKVIGAGDSAIITVRLKGTDRVGSIAQTVRVITNDPSNPVRELRLLANILTGE